MSETPLPDSLENFLRNPPQLLQPTEARAALLRQTLRRVRKPRRWRRWAAAAGIVLALASAYFGWRSRDIPLPPLPVVVEHKPALPPEQPKPPSAVEVPVDPLALEWSAFDATEDPQRVRLYFQAGDLYLEREQNFEAALRCYHQALEYCAADELEQRPNDNWLVMVLKNDRRKEP